jgi:hypothetical protein
VQRRFLRGLWIIILAGIALGLNGALPARAETQISNPRWEYIFGRQITFSADLKSDIAVAEARFYFVRPEDAQANVVPIVMDEQGVLNYEYDFMRFPLRAFSSVKYWFEVVVAGGETVRSNPEVFYYEDNRFVWQILQSGPFRVHWYDGDTAFGQALLDVAQRGLIQAQSWLPVVNPDEINIYTYASKEEMRSTLLLGGTNWVAGHADPDMQLIVVTISPGPEQRTEMERQIPHELMHTLLYQLLDRTVGPAAYYKLPTWLIEGLASVNEIYPNPYYHTILSQAADRGGLLSFSDICKNFPVDASGAYLAYAQAASFTRYLYDQYGAEGLETLVVIYTQNNELDCQDGTAKALGTPLNELERSWRQTALGEKIASTEASSPWPWVAVLGVVLTVPFIILIFNTFRRARKSQSTVNSGRSA